MKNRRWAILATVAAGVLLAGCSSKNDQTTAPIAKSNSVALTPAQRRNIKVVAVEAGSYHRTIETSGTVDFDNDQATSVLAPVSGPVSRIMVSLGDQVKKGAPLAVVESPDFAAAVGAYHKAIATAQTNRRLADLDKDLAQHNGVAQREAAQAETDAANAEADRDSALQALVALNVPASAIKNIQEGRPVSRLEGMIRSPIAGTVVEKLITPGQLLSAGATPCFTVADLARVWVMARVFGSSLASVSVGDTAEVMTDLSSDKFSGRIDNISALVDPDTRSVMVRVVVDNPGGFLKKQMYVRVLIESRKESTGLLVPVSSILRDDENLPFVYLVGSDGTFARRHVTVGYRTGDRYDVADGLKAGDQIVADGGIFVQFMQNQ